MTGFIIKICKQFVLFLLAARISFLKKIYSVHQKVSRKSCNFDVISFVKPQGKKICIFASFSDTSKVQEDVLYYLSYLVESGFSILFVTTSKEIKEQDFTILQKYCFGIIRRENISLDFGSWHTGLIHLKNNNVAMDSILFANDSVIGPLFPISIPSTNTLEIFGMTENWAITPHIQSYFMYFSNQAIQSEFFKNFWFSNFRYMKNKKAIIMLYEIGISEMARSYGFKISPAFSYRDLLSTHFKLADSENINLISNKQIALNPTHFFWDTSVIGLQMPFIKKELLFKNPANVPNIHANLKKIIQKLKTESSGLDTQPIREYLNRFLSK